MRIATRETHSIPITGRCYVGRFPRLETHNETLLENIHFSSVLKLNGRTTRSARGDAVNTESGPRLPNNASKGSKVIEVAGKSCRNNMKLAGASWRSFEQYSASQKIDQFHFEYHRDQCSVKPFLTLFKLYRCKTISIFVTCFPFPEYLSVLKERRLTIGCNSSGVLSNWISCIFYSHRKIVGRYLAGSESVALQRDSRICNWWDCFAEDHGSQSIGMPMSTVDSINAF